MQTNFRIAMCTFSTSEESDLQIQRENHKTYIFFEISKLILKGNKNIKWIKIIYLHEQRNKGF